MVWKTRRHRQLWGHGGGKCAAQLPHAGGLKMRPVAAMPGIVLTPEMIKGGSFRPEKDLQTRAGVIRLARAELAVILDSPAV